MFSSKCMFFECVTFVALAAALFSAAPATADTILYSDTFSRGTVDTPVVLNGSSPDYTSGQYGATAGATWTAVNIIGTAKKWATDGSVANITYNPGTQGAAAGLPFTPQANHIYTFSATIQCTYGTAASSWTTMGFSQYVSTSEVAYYSSSINPYGWAAVVYQPSSTNQHQAFAGVGISGETLIGYATGPVQMQEVLNTNVTPWQETWIVNGTTQSGPVALGTGYANIHFISFGCLNNTTGTVDNVQLSVDVPVPEPSTLALLGAGLFGLLCYAWRKRRCVPSQTKPNTSFLPCAKNLCALVCVSLALAAVVVLADFAQANTMTLVNGSFEDPTLTGDDDHTVPTGWSLNPSCPAGSDRETVGAGNYTAPVDGVAEWCFNSSRYASNDATGIQQDLGTMTTGDVYTLTGTLLAYDASSNYSWSAIKDVFNISFFDVTTSATLATINQTNFNLPGAAPPGASMPISMTYTATAADNGHTLRLVLFAQATSSTYAYFDRQGVDDLKISTVPAPEPSTLALLAAALAGLLCYAWRKRR